MSQLTFTAYTKPVPQGSMKGFVIKGRAVLTSANKLQKPCRSEVTARALDAAAIAGQAVPVATKGVPVSVLMDFYFEKPPSVSKKRTHMVVKSDLDKLVRLVNDSLTGVAYFDDAQVVEISARKHYGSPERIEVSVTTL